MKFKISINLPWHILTLISLAAVALVVTVGLLAYRSYIHLAKSQEMQLELVKTQAEEQERRNKEASALIEAQARALKEAQGELEKTKAVASETSSQVTNLKKALAEQSSSPKDIIISSKDIAAYTDAVVQVLCKQGQNVSSGSGTLWNFKELPQAVITNYHVVKDAESCVVVMSNSNNQTTGIFSLTGSVYTFNQNTDTAILGIGASVSSSSVPIKNYNYSVTNVRKCPASIPVGSPVVIIGYPAYAKRDATMSVNTLGTVNVIYRTVTNGIISGYDTSLVSSGALKNENYFVSSKIDSGNSGGLSLAKDANGICVLGLPTWLTMGSYETQGLVQNIANLIP